MGTYTLKYWTGCTIGVNLKLSDPPTREEIRELAKASRMRIKDVRRGLYREKDGRAVWESSPPPEQRVFQ